MEVYGSLPDVEAIIPVSAQMGNGLPELVDQLTRRVLEGGAFYAVDELTDRSVRFLCAELLREQVFLQTYQEIPYGVVVEIEKFEEDEERVEIMAVVHVECAAQCPILLGKGGTKMRDIATKARAEMKVMLEKKVYLEVFVHVEANWSERLSQLHRFGYARR
jgi:GTP-binding protein Era